MSTLRRLLARLFDARASHSRRPLPDELALHDWADLPTHHPRCDEAPC